MSWCPNCKIEYVSGIESCNECGSELVECLVEDENTKHECEEDKYIPGMIASPAFSQKNYKVARLIKMFAVLFFILGLGHSLYTTIDYWNKLQSFSQAISESLSIQQFITMLGRVVFYSLLLFSLGEGLQILHDIKIKIDSK